MDGIVQEETEAITEVKYKVKIKKEIYLSESRNTKECRKVERPR